MGDVNQFAWVKRNLGLIRPPVLEIGSKDYGSVSQGYRTLLEGMGCYVGTDLAPGKNVDVVADLTGDFEVLPAELRACRFRTILCMSVMEHVRDVYRFAGNLARLLEEDGYAFISVPWVWRFHGYPSDFWRFSPEALKFLFEKMRLLEDRSCVTHREPGQCQPLSNAALGVYADYERDSAPPSSLGRRLLGLYHRITKRIAPRMSRQPQFVLYPTAINAVFHKPAA